MDAIQKQINKMMGVSDEVFAKYNPSPEAVAAKKIEQSAVGLTENQRMINKMMGVSDEVFAKYNSPATGEAGIKKVAKLVYAGDLAEDVPVWWRFWPKGWVQLEGEDPVLVDDVAMAEVIANFERRGNDLVIDYEHSSIFADKAPAAGWVKAMEMRPDGLWVRSEWTEQARQFIANKEYRYFSPAFDMRLSDRRPIKINSVALTNTPQTNQLNPLINKNNVRQKEV